MDSEQTASPPPEDLELGKTPKRDMGPGKPEALEGTSKDDPDPSPTPPPPSGNEEWTGTYKPVALDLVPMEMAFLLASIWAASFGEKPQFHWTWVPMLLIQCMVTVSLCLCLFALLSTNMTDVRRSRLVVFSVVFVMISIVLSVISSVVYNRASLN